MHYVYLVIAIIGEVIGTSFMKESDGFTKFTPSLITIASYAVAFYFLAQTLRVLSTGVAYAIWSGLGIVLISLVAWLWQGDKLDTPAMAGMAMIIAGVVVMNVFSSTAAH